MTIEVYLKRSSESSFLLIKPKLIELSADWSPWKFQIQTFGEGKDYDSKTPIICIGTSNFETRKDAEQMLASLTAIHNRHY